MCVRVCMCVCVRARAWMWVLLGGRATKLLGIGCTPEMVLIKTSHSPGNERRRGADEEKASICVLVPVLPRLCKIAGNIHPLLAAHEQQKAVSQNKLAEEHDT